MVVVLYCEEGYYSEEETYITGVFEDLAAARPHVGRRTGARYHAQEFDLNVETTDSVARPSECDHPTQHCVLCGEDQERDVLAEETIRREREAAVDRRERHFAETWPSRSQDLQLLLRDLETCLTNVRTEWPLTQSRTMMEGLLLDLAEAAQRYLFASEDEELSLRRRLGCRFSEIEGSRLLVRGWPEDLPARIGKIARWAACPRDTYDECMR